MNRTFTLPGYSKASALKIKDLLDGEVTAFLETPAGLQVTVTPTCNLHRVGIAGHNLRDLEERYILENSVAYQELLQVAETIISRVQEGSIRSQRTYKACLRAVAFSQLSQRLANLVQSMDWDYNFREDSEGRALEQDLRALAEKEQKIEQVLMLAPDGWSFSV